MSKGDTFENDLLKLIFNGTAIANLADNAASSPLTNLYVSFHTADPGDSGNQTTSETAYTSYARVAVARTGSGWSVSGNTATLVPNLDAPKCTGSPGGALTHFGVGTAASSTGKLLYKGALSPNITMAIGVTPRLEAGSTVTED